MCNFYIWVNISHKAAAESSSVKSSLSIGIAFLSVTRLGGISSFPYLAVIQTELTDQAACAPTSNGSVNESVA